jgi:p-hydroxybenzoate 3-monooxygenase
MLRKALARVWKAQRFSLWMTTTTMRHTFPELLAYDQKLLENGPRVSLIVGEDSGVVAESYVGLPF